MSGSVRPLRFAILAALAVACSGSGNASPAASVFQPVVTSVVVSPSTASLVVGGTQQFGATAFDQNGSAMSGQGVNWSSSNTVVASVSSSGLATAAAAGTATINATASGVSGNATVTVTPPVVSRVTLTPANVTISVGAQTTVVATAFDAQNVVISGRTATFATSNAAVATVTQGGVVNGVAPGVATMTVTIDGVAASSNVTVNAVGSVVTSVTVIPNPVSLIVGASSQLLATPRDAQGAAVAGKTIAWLSANPSVATVTPAGAVTAVSVGTSTVTATTDAVSGSSVIDVIGAPTGNTILVTPSQMFQTITGWEGTNSIGEVECNQVAYQNYKAPVIDRLVNELGINRVRLEVRSGYENTVDYFPQYRSGQITYAQWKATWYAAVNDNADPNVIDPARFQWGWFDYVVDEVVLPLRAKLQARGEKLYVNLNYVDFRAGLVKSWIIEKHPAEYAEFLVATFQHMQQKYGFTPDAVELLLEPQNAGDLNTGVYGPDLGAAVVAAGNRLASLGYRPDFIAPSDASMSNSLLLYDSMILTPGALPFIKELSYHRYQGVSQATLQTIASRGQRDRIQTSMLEWNQGVNIDTLIEDLTIGNVSSWQQYSMAYCENRTNANPTGIYYQVNQSNPANPIVTITNNARDYRQIFLFVRAGAVRLGATSGNPALLSTVAFRNTTGKHVAVVRAQSAAVFSVNGLPAGTYGVKYSVQQPWDVDLPDVVVTAGGSANASLPAKGVLTFYQR